MEPWIFEKYKLLCYKIADNISFEQEKEIHNNENDKCEYKNYILKTVFDFRKSQLTTKCEYSEKSKKVYLWFSRITKNNFFIRPHNYLAYRNIKQKFRIIDDCYSDNAVSTENESIYEENLKAYFKQLKKFIELDEIQKILNTDYWIDVPIDWGPYK